VQRLPHVFLAVSNPRRDFPEVETEAGAVRSALEIARAARLLGQVIPPPRTLTWKELTNQPGRHPKALTRAGRRFIDGIREERWASHIISLRDALVHLAGDLSSEQKLELSEFIANAMREPTAPKAVSSLGFALAHLGEGIPHERRISAARIILGAMEQRSKNRRTLTERHRRQLGPERAAVEEERRMRSDLSDLGSVLRTLTNQIACAKGQPDRERTLPRSMPSPSDSFPPAGRCTSASTGQASWRVPWHAMHGDTSPSSRPTTGGSFSLWHGLGRPCAGRRGRVVSVSSWGHRFSPVAFENPNFRRRASDRWSAYGQSKTANILFALALDERGKTVTCRGVPSRT